MNPKLRQPKLGRRLKRVVNNSPSDIKKTVRTMLAGNYKERAEALRKVCERGGKDLAQLARQLVKSKRTVPASEGIYLLGTFGTPKDLPLLNTLMYSKNSFVRDRAIEMMGRCREPKGLEYLEVRKRTNNISIRKFCEKAIALNKGMDYELYGKSSENPKFKDPKRNVVRRGQDKDGSTTVLLGGKLYNRAIIRGGMHSAISNKGKKILIGMGLLPNAVELWKKAFEFDWKKVGLPHNPVEPILKKNGKYRIYKNIDGSLRVSTKVISGETLTVFKRKHPVTDEMCITIEKQIEQIQKGLDILKIDHSHPHNSNYVIQLVEGKLKVFIIDFDAAKEKSN